jgi:hypothetical protein
MQPTNRPSAYDAVHRVEMTAFDAQPREKETSLNILKVRVIWVTRSGIERLTQSIHFAYSLAK